MTVQGQSQRRAGIKMTEEIRVYAPPELKRLAGEAADLAGIPLSEFVVRAVAKELARPDLAAVPRKSIGRPRNKQIAAQAS